jgi:predicted DNA-binding transcriptional regulator AlpA
MLRVPDVLSLLQISRRTLFAYIADGLPVHRLSVRVIRFDQDEVLEWARNRCSDRERGDGSSAA